MERRHTWRQTTFEPPERTVESLSLEFETGFFEAVLARDPENIEALFALGNAYTRSGEYIKGLDIDTLLVKLLPDDGTARYNLACSYSLLGDVEQALEELEKAIELGYDDMEFLKSDPDLENIRRHPRFESVISMLENWESP